ncbi:hypothetical protein Ancab_001614 [Ancistrocladus abbreviatus]
MTSCVCQWPLKSTKTMTSSFIIPRAARNGAVLVVPGKPVGFRASKVRASAVDSHDTPSNFIKRMEKAWLISQQPTPIACRSCNANGKIECKWCGGTGFFILGDNMLCQVPSRNTSCVICAGKVSNSPANSSRIAMPCVSLSSYFSAFILQNMR